MVESVSPVSFRFLPDRILTVPASNVVIVIIMRMEGMIVEFTIIVY
jgi:hypothetical protein